MSRVSCERIKVTKKQIAAGAFALGFACLLATDGSSWAQTTESSTVNVLANSVTTCTITAGDLNFGDYDGTETTIPSSITGVGQIFASLDCTVGFVEAVFCLNEGQFYNGTRHMRNTANPTSLDPDDNISYEIYRENTGFTVKMGETPDPSDTTTLDCSAGGVAHPGLELFNDPATNASQWAIRAELRTLGGGANPGSYSDSLVAAFVFK